jgi:hypothetical protein
VKVRDGVRVGVTVAVCGGVPVEVRVGVLVPVRV